MASLFVSSERKKTVVEHGKVWVEKKKTFAFIKECFNFFGLRDVPFHATDA